MESDEDGCSQICTKGQRFACDELYLSDESDDEFDCEPESFLMSKMGLAENALYEVINDHQTAVKEDIRIYRLIFAVAMLLTYMGLNMDGPGLPGFLTKSQPTELLQQP